MARSAEEKFFPFSGKIFSQNGKARRGGGGSDHPSNTEGGGGPTPPPTTLET